MIKVNNQELNKNEFQGACYNYMAHTRKQELTKEDKVIVANQLVDTNLLLTDGKSLGYKPQDAEIEASFEKLLSQFPSREQFDKTLEEMGDTVDTVKNRLSDDIILKNYIEGEFYSKITVAEDAIEAFYKEHEDKFVEPEQVKASHILVKEEADIKAIHEDVKGGAAFDEIAKEKSECPSGQNGGDLGFFGKGKMVPEFETTAFAMSVGDVSEPFKTDFGYHIIKLTDKSEGGKQSLEVVAENIKRHLEQVEAQKTISAKVVELRANATIEIDEEAL